MTSMDYFIKANKKLIIYTLSILIIIPIFGIKLILGIVGNILILLFLIPLLVLLLVLIGFNSYRSKIITCSNCGAISLNLSKSCINCGADLENISRVNELNEKPSERTIEVKAEEIK